MPLFNPPGKTTWLRRALLSVIALISMGVAGFTQKPDETDTSSAANHRVIVPGKQYQKSSFHQWLWGRHYRKDWATPVSFPIVNLDTMGGGLTAYEAGGGRQSKTLRLRNAAEKEYVLRSIDKTYGRALPEMYRKTFLADIINDQVSTGQPYAALTIPPMAQAAGIYHTQPQIVFVPTQQALGKYNDDYGNELYLFEQRPDENWEEAANFGFSKKIVGTDKMLEKILADNDNHVDQLAFVRARLFDMFIGDWGRHEDQWRWASFEKDDEIIYRPVPRDRDQTYSKLDGMLLGLIKSAAGAGHLQSFGPTIKDVTTYNFPARNLDRLLTNEISGQQWIEMAEQLKQALTDAVIEEGVKQLPPEIFAISGNEIINNLRSRRDHLAEYAAAYYAFLAKEVDIPATRDNEFIEVKKISDNETQVTIYDLNKEGKPKNKPFYSRTFYNSETREVRVYGLSGKDQYKFEAQSNNPMPVRIIGGPEHDVYTNTAAHPASRIHVYDNADNDFSHAVSVQKHLSGNPYIHTYTYDAFKYDSKGISPSFFYNTEDHFYVGLKYHIEKQQWRKYPFGYQQSLGVRYSVSEQAFSFDYKSLYTQLIGSWDLFLNANYDFIRWNNFFGIGNETSMLTLDRNYYRTRSKEFITEAGIQRHLWHFHTIRLSGFYQTVKILNDNGRFLSQRFSHPFQYGQKNFAGAKLDYTIQKLDNGLVPARGVKFLAGIAYTQNVHQPDSAFTRYSSSINFYIPLLHSFILSIKAGGATLTGKPEFYQLNRIGGASTLRGFRKYRFYGESVAYNQNELQFVKDVRSYLYSGKLGILALYDIGRVWQPGEQSSLWHTAVGGGIILAPFDKIAVTATYAFSQNEHNFSLRINKAF